MGVFHVFFEPLKLKIYLKTLEATDVAIRFLVFFCFLALLPELWKFVDDCAGKDLEDNLFDEQNVANFAD